MKRDKPTAEELDWIRRFLEFANHSAFTTQREAYDVFLKEPHPFIMKDGDRFVFSPLPESDGVKPFLNDRKAIRRLLTDLASREPRAADRARALVVKHLGRTLDATLNVRWKKGELRLDVEPRLTGMEACVYYPLALLFHYGLDRRVRVCDARVWRETRYIERWQIQEGHDALKEKSCGAFYITSLNGAARSGCSAEHNAMISRQKNVRRVQKHRGALSDFFVE